jgi:tetratricopeptide (TPR) repeat protein
MNGQLRDLPVVEIIREINESRMSGVLRLANDRLKEVIYFDSGEIILASSNVRTHRLSECFLRWKILSDEELSPIKELPDKQFCQAVLEKGLVNKIDLDKLLARQAFDTIAPSLLWSNGEWTFDTRVRPAEDARIQLNWRELVLEGAHRLSTDFISIRFPDKNENINPIAGITHDELKLLPEEAFIYSRVDRQISLHDITLISGMAEAKVLRAVYALALVRLLERTKWPTSLTSHPSPQSNKPIRSVPVNQAEKAKPEASTSEPETKDEKQELETLFQLAEKTDYYQILKVERSVKTAEIKQAYYALVKRFHPDRFHQTSDSALRSRIEIAFGKITQAYETLKDDKLRASYDLRMQSNLQTNASVIQTQQPNSNTQTSSDASLIKQKEEAEKNFQTGLTALKQNNYALALKSFAEAARLEPSQARYRAYYGRELARDPKTRRTAEVEILAAVSLDASNPSYHVMLAELYRDVGLIKRAEGEIRQALALDPKHTAARQILHDLIVGTKNKV